MANESGKPEKKFQAGGVSVALWKNKAKLKSGQEIETLSATIDRRYMDKDGKWQSSSSLKLNDIPKALLALGQAYQYMATKSENGEETPVEEVVA